MRVLPLVSCGPPWSPVVFCGVLCCSVRCRCLPSCPLMCCSLSLCCRVVLCLYLLLLLCLVFALGVLYAIGLCLVARLFTDWFVHCFVCSFICLFACLFSFSIRSLVYVSLLFFWSGIVGSWLVSFARCFWSICWLVLVRKNMLYESPPR